MNAPLKRPPLPESWVDRIFDRMQGMYGSLWVDRWRSGETVERNGASFDRGLLLAKETWAEYLSGFRDQPERLSKALEACKSMRMPPTLPEFLALCRQQATDVPAALPAPQMTRDEREARQRQAAAEAKAIAKSRDGNRDWAHKLRSMYLAGERLSHIQIELASGALDEVWKDGKCSSSYDAVA